MNATTGNDAVEFARFGETVEQFGDLVDHRFEYPVVDVSTAMPLGQIDDADGQRLPRADRLRYPPAAADAAIGEIEPDEFARAAANVEKDGAGSIRVDQRRTARRRQTRFRLLRNDLKVEVSLAFDAPKKNVAILGEAAGFGRDQPRANHGAMVELALADLQRFDRAIHRRVRQEAGLTDPLAQPNDPRKGIDDAEAALARRRDQETAIVGTEIERRVVAARSAPLRSVRRRATDDICGRHEHRLGGAGTVGLGVAVGSMLVSARPSATATTPLRRGPLAIVGSYSTVGRLHRNRFAGGGRLLARPRRAVVRSHGNPLGRAALWT